MVPRFKAKIRLATRQMSEEEERRSNGGEVVDAGGESAEVDAKAREEMAERALEEANKAAVEERKMLVKAAVEKELDMLQHKLGEVAFETFSDVNMLKPVISLVEKDLSEPYSIYTYRYFLLTWVRCFLVVRGFGDQH